MPDHPSITGHEEFVVGHYETLTETLYRPTLGPDHLHLGYWPRNEIQRACKSLDDTQDLPAALERLIVETIAPAGIASGDLVIDAGCGVGGTTRFIAEHHLCRVIGLDATSLHIALARKRDQRLDPEPSSRIEYKVADVTDPWDLPASTAAIIVSIESARHYRRHNAFLEQVVQALRPGGRLALTDWMRTEPMTAREYADHLTPVCQCWAAWKLESLESYCNKLNASGLHVTEAEDLGDHVKPNAHLFLRHAKRYAELNQPALAEPFRLTARAWLDERMTLGRILAIK